jgi:hypothetical protein
LQKNCSLWKVKEFATEMGEIQHTVKTMRKKERFVFLACKTFSYYAYSALFLGQLTSDCTHNFKDSKGKAIPVIGREVPQGCQMSRLPHILDTWLIDGGEAVSLTRRLPFTTMKDSWYSILLEVESTPGTQCSW